MMLSLGLDIGGANTKAVFFRDENVERHWLEYIPLWKDKDSLGFFLEKLSEMKEPETLGVTMTGELADVFESKEEGVKEIINTVENIFPDSTIYYLNLKGELITKDEALSSVKQLYASNWVSSGLLIGKEHPNSILIDVGSTTTDIIPIKKGKPKPIGETDFERLKTSELIYTGTLRTPLPYLKSKIKLQKNEIGIAAEYFAITADVYRVLDLIDKKDYTCETPDGRGKTKKECMARIARIFASDLEEIREELIIKTSKIFHKTQINQVKKGLEKVTTEHKINKKTPIIITGIGKQILAQKAAEKAKYEKIIDLEEKYNKTAALMTPAYALGILAREAHK